MSDFDYKQFLATKSPHTRRAVNYVLKDFHAFLAGRGISERTVQSYVNHLASKNAPSTVHQRFSIIRSFIDFNNLDVRCKRISLPKANRKPRVPLSDESMEKYFELADRIKSDCTRSLLKILPLTGLRVSEACSVRKCDIVRRGADCSLRILGKGNKERIVPLNEEAKRIVLERAKHASGDLLFDVTPSSTYKTMASIGRRLGVKVHPHLMRHTFITTLCERGVPIHVVQDIVGHSSGATTLGYAHASAKSKQQAVEGLYDGHG